MKIGRTLWLIKLLFGVNSTILEMLRTDGFEEKCRRKIRRQDKIKRKLI